MYGLLIGRFQPFHLGHLAIVNEIITDGLMPAFLIGSPEVAAPLTAEERALLISNSVSVPPMIAILPDYPNEDDKWVAHVDSMLKRLQGGAKIYYYRKPVDVNPATGKHYIDLLKEKLDCEFKEATFPTKLGLTVAARDIRADLESHRHLVPGNVYRHMQEKIVTNATFH